MKLRVSTVQYHLHAVRDFSEFAAQVEHYTKVASEYKADFLLFPELFTTQLLTIDGGRGRSSSIEDLPRFTVEYELLFQGLAQEYRMHIVGGTHIVRENGRLYNTCYLFYPDGRFAKQKKLHITPAERKDWNIRAGNELQVFATDKCTVALLVCYDIEFPEIVRIARARGADVIFCPSCTDDRHGFLRVRYTSHARAVENQVYVVTSGTVGSLPSVGGMLHCYGQSAVIAPNDIPFPPGGIVAEGEINQDMLVTADLDLTLLHQIRERGSVTTWRDRRTDLYPDWS